MSINANLLEAAIQKSFIDKSIPSNTLNPQFIINKPEKKDFFLNVLQNELDNCKAFIISVAFITQDGLNAIKAQLSDLARRGISGRILTSTYLGFNEPKVFTSLLEIPNVEVRVSNKPGFHSKGYLFEQENHRSFIIGSSNLTMSALKLNYEWNVKLTSTDYGEMITEIHQHLEDEWQKAEPLTPKWISDFASTYVATVNPKTLTGKLMVSGQEKLPEDYIVPNKMQKAALKNLRDIRQNQAKRALVISATGTGKTYLAGFDVRQFNPKKMLFIVHREQILNKAVESFKKIMGGPDSDYGILSGNSKDLHAKYLFATIQTVSKDSYQQQLGRDAFDYILIDEVHKAGANSYTKTIDFFQPEFLLGMTATPERTDGFNIFELFDYNIAYEIRLPEALEEKMLCPFHYFGVTDYEKDGEIIDETTDLSYLIESERVDFLIEKIKYYGCSGNDPKGLIFCSRKTEAQKLSELFNQKGIPASYLSGEDDISTREREVERLESGEIKYIFTVDIFNEGIDIPKINQVVMLRNTQSSIIFTQQLGRGLRIDDSKDFVTVIDFIGNYKNNYMIPMALSGDNSRNKSSLRRDTIDVNYISGLSSINFEKIAKERIFKSIDKAKLDSVAELRNSFVNLENRINRVPYLIDFQNFGSIDPLLITNKYKTYYQFLKTLGKAEGELSELEDLALRFVCSELLIGLRPHELMILSNFIKLQKEDMTVEDIKTLFEKKEIPCDDETLDSTLKVLDLSFYESVTRKRYMGAKMLMRENNRLKRTENFIEFQKNPYFVKLLDDAIETGLAKTKEYDLTKPLNLYKKYRRKDALRMVNMEFKQNEQGIGGYTYSNHHFAIFVTLDKGKDFQASIIAYEDEFLDERTFRWFTKSGRNMNSPEVQVLQNAENWKIHLFIKRKYQKSDNETDFYYLGEMQPIKDTIQQVQKPSGEGKLTNIVEMDFLLKDPVEPNMYEFLIGSNEEETR